jgi:hypothetical protein
LEEITANRIRLKPGNYVGIALASGAVILAGGVWILSGIFPIEFVWGATALVLGFLWIQLGTHKKINKQAWALGLTLIVVVDLGGVDRSSFAMRSPGQVLSEGGEAARYLARQPGSFRVYSPSYSLPQQTAAVYGLELADGVDPLQLAAYAGFMDKASGVPRKGYSVTVPPFATGDPPTDNMYYQPDPDLLGWLNVSYVVAAFDFEVDGLRLLQQFGGTRIYANDLVRPRSWVQPDTKISREKFEPVQVIDWEPNRVEVHATGPGVLVFSEIAYPGWRSTVDGEPHPIMIVEGLLRGVILPAGPHQVVLDYQPVSLYVGLAFLAIGIGLIILRKLRTVISIAIIGD